MLNKEELNKLIDDLYDKASHYNEVYEKSSKEYYHGISIGLDIAIRELRKDFFNDEY